MADNTITVRSDGPYIVAGPVKVVDGDGNEFKVKGDGDLVFLCRCGHSANKPFCDGAHKKTGFQAEAKA